MVRIESRIGREDPLFTNDSENANPPLLIEKLPSFSSLPMVDHITVYSNCDSSFGDMSSVSSDEEDNDENDQCYTTPSKALSPLPSPRSIFGRYWEKNVGAVVDPFETLKMISLATSVFEDDVASCNTYERTLQRPPVVCSTTPSSLPRRRIFPNASFNRVDLPCVSSRKTHSDSRLLKQTTVSCLRRSRFSRHGSSSSEEQSHSEHSSVSFSPKVDVIVFRRPVEHWAAKGWSEYFS